MQRADDLVDGGLQFVVFHAAPFIVDDTTLTLLRRRYPFLSMIQPRVLHAVPRSVQTDELRFQVQPYRVLLCVTQETGPQSLSRGIGDRTRR